MNFSNLQLALVDYICMGLSMVAMVSVFVFSVIYLLTHFIIISSTATVESPSEELI